jgi:hypothetical protein
MVVLTGMTAYGLFSGQRKRPFRLGKVANEGYVHQGSIGLEENIGWKGHDGLHRD